jgi:hypothetical protein
MRTVTMSLGLLLSTLLVGACDETAKACFEQTDKPLKQRISACGELCDKDDAKACATQVDLALAACVEKGDKETCRWMCDYAKDKDLFCKKHKELGG